MPYITEYPLDLGDDLNWVIKRMDHGSYVEFEIHEGQTYKDSDVPRATLEVTVWLPRLMFGGKMGGPEISWPSTSDKRPVLARALAVALTHAADFADSLPTPDPEVV